MNFMNSTDSVPPYISILGIYREMENEMETAIVYSRTSIFILNPKP